MQFNFKHSSYLWKGKVYIFSYMRKNIQNIDNKVAFVSNSKDDNPK